MENKIKADVPRNHEQLSYYDAMQAARSNTDPLIQCAAAGLANTTGAFAVTSGIVSILNAPIGAILSVALGVLYIYVGLRPSAKIATRIKHSAGLCITGYNPKAYPLEHVDSIVMDDLKGLEHLLERTANKENLEWGTVLKAHEDKQKAAVYEIVDSYEAAKKGLIVEATETLLAVDEKKAKRLGYNGFQHYHPMASARNFEVSNEDRTILMGFINLLSFNRASGPEIIGYNYKYVYIPADKSKTTLVRATPEDIMKYLAK